MSPIISTLQKENIYVTIVGDFNINLLQNKWKREIWQIFQSGVYQ